MRILSLILLTVSLLSTGVKADNYVKFESVEFLGEHHGAPGTWTQLRFAVLGISSDLTSSMYSDNRAEFTLDAAYNWFRTDLRFNQGWLARPKFDSTHLSEAYFGSRAPNAHQRRDLRKLPSSEKLMAAWIIANTDELIEFALKSKKINIPVVARNKWESLAKNDKFERNIRKNLAPFYRAEISAYDLRSKHSKLSLINLIQPNLQKLGYYKGELDGLWGSQTKSAILKFEHDNNLFPDGLIYGKDRELLKILSEDVEKYGNTPATKQLIVDLENGLLKVSNSLAEQKKKTEEAERKARKNYMDKARLENQIFELKNNNLSSEEKSKLHSEIASWRDKASSLKDLAEGRFKTVTALNRKIRELEQELHKLKTEHQKLESDLIETNQAELKSLAASLKKEIANLKSELAESKRATTDLPKFKLDGDWIELERYLAVQQIRFCQILMNYEKEAVSAAESRNQLRQNLVATNRDNDIAALLPGGNYESWVVKVVEIYATPAGDAAFVLRLPCAVTFGSGKLPEIDGTDGVYAATAEYGGIIYNQLSQLAEGDTVLISGKILTYSDIGNKNQKLNFVTTLFEKNLKIDSSPVKHRSTPDYFSSVDYLSKL